MNFIKTEIEKAFNQKKLICICINKIDWDKRIIGYVRYIQNLEKFEIETIDEFGQFKNVKTILFASVRSLEMGGIYNNNLEKLNEKGFKKDNSIAKYFSFKKHNLYDKLVKLKEEGIICTFFFKTEFSIGVVKEVTQEELFISNIAYDGTDDGTSLFNVKLLTKIRSTSNFERRLTFLRKTGIVGR